uniref:Uncharacterized protein n=1 Tax=Bionectria ochroleuca TaxID=29856 RepID=A0A0B7K327_BIOOC
MAAASASLRQKLFNLRPPALRSAFSTGSRCLKARRGFGARYIPEECKTFYFPDGRLWTTPENTQFLSRYGIEHDVALATVPAMDPEMRQVAQKFKATLSFSPRHIIDPFYAKWARWSEERPLWLICSVNGGPKRVVRLRAMRRVRHALYTALEEKGYDKYGNRKGRRIKGTLRIHLNQPLEAVSIPSHEFGPPLVKLLEKLTSQTQIRRTAPNASRKTSRPRAW